MTERNPEHTRHYDRTLNGVTVNVWARPKSCFFCEHCTDMFVDLDGSPYLWFCELEKDIDDGMYERCENFKDDNFDMRGRGMTREEAIQELQNCKGLIQQDGQDYLDERDIPLLDMAIEALSTPSGDLISRADAIEAVCKGCHWWSGQCDNDKAFRCDEVCRIEALPSADAVKRVDCSNFLLWLLEEIMDEDNWEFNAVADGEIIARKLKKLGLLEVKDGYYHRIFDENVWVVRCKDCEYADFNSPYPVCNFLEMNICENGYCSWARMKGGAE